MLITLAEANCRHRGAFGYKHGRSADVYLHLINNSYLNASTVTLICEWEFHVPTTSSSCESVARPEFEGKLMGMCTCAQSVSVMFVPLLVLEHLVSSHWSMSHDQN